MSTHKPQATGQGHCRPIVVLHQIVVRSILESFAFPPLKYQDVFVLLLADPFEQADEASAKSRLLRAPRIF
jgi:hypothetical protein